jgi:hypothetical protein
MYFNTKNYLKSNHNYTTKQTKRQKNNTGKKKGPKSNEQAAVYSEDLSILPLVIDLLFSKRTANGGEGTIIF